MKTIVELNDDLLKKVKRITKAKTTNAAIEYALQLVVTLDSQKQLVDLWGQVQIYEQA